jgi:hypothetical protein
MKKRYYAALLALVMASGAFGQSTEDEWFKKAGEYYDNGDYANAVTAYSETIKRNSSNLNAYWFRSIAYFQLKNYDATIADCDTVIKSAPDFPNVYMARGDAYGAKGIYHKAAADYRTGLVKGYDPAGYRVDKSSKADMWFCGALYMEIAVNRFLGKSDVVTKYENWLKIACDKNGVTRAEVESFYRQNIGGLITGVVDEEFGKVSFLLDKTDQVSYNATLTRDVKNQYVLNYDGYFNGTRSTKTLSVTSLETLLIEMRRNTTDFSQTSINQVSTQATLIPAASFEHTGKDPRRDIATILYEFYINPNNATVYGAVRDVNVFYSAASAIAYKSVDRRTYERLSQSYLWTLESLSQELAQKVITDSYGRTSTTLSVEVRNRLQLGN